MKLSYSSVIFVLLTSNVFAALRPPIFHTKNGKYFLTLTHSGDFEINSYEIMEGKLDAKAEEFVPIHKEDNPKQNGNKSIIVDLSPISRQDRPYKYSISVETTKGERISSEAFRYDAENKKFTLERLYNDKSILKKYFIPISIGSGILLLGLGVLVYKRLSRKKNEESL